MLKIRCSLFEAVLFVSLFIIYFSLFSVSYAAHPLITDDTGTQGKGKYQIELNSELAHEYEDGATEDALVFASILSYGLTDSVDVVLGIPCQFIRLKEGGKINSESGLSDISFELKWRFYEKDGLSFALKPVITLPTGDDDKGLGVGKVTYSAFFIATKEIQPWAFHLNLGYISNQNKDDERKDLWHASAAAQVEVMKDLNLVGNIGVERNSDRSVDTHPAFILGGVIYSLSKNLDIDFGVKGGLNKPETDYSVLAGLAWRF